ncbi:MAG TPA: hypothetical protein DD473_15425 [Planctomycetaceae bacterium]|nr:hypothetical protein [Planctomycetaceae bacterium]|tara:strand:+ start:48 stop:1154 length:1107 start_codon:yes stop_codon:yes gene_type:complete
MSALYTIILILHIPELYASGGIYLSNIILLGYIAIKALYVKPIKSWPLWVFMTPILVFFLDVWHGSDFKSLVFCTNMIGLIYIFPNISLSKAHLAREIHIIVLVSILFLAAFVVMNPSSFGSIAFSKANHWYPLATPNMIGVLAVIVIVISMENKYHWLYWGFGIFSLAFMPLIFGVFLALGVYAVWRLPGYLKLLVIPAAIGLIATRFDFSILNDTTLMDSISSFRFSIWVESMEYISENPVFGMGLEQWPEIMGEFINPHNFMIYFVMSYGYTLGIMLIMVAIYLAFEKSEKAGRSIVRTKAIVVVMIAYQLVYVGNIGHYSAFGNIITLLFGIHLIHQRDLQLPRAHFSSPARMPVRVSPALARE